MILQVQRRPISHRCSSSLVALVWRSVPALVEDDEGEEMKEILEAQSFSHKLRMGISSFSGDRKHEASLPDDKFCG